MGRKLPSPKKLGSVKCSSEDKLILDASPSDIQDLQKILPINASQKNESEELDRHVLNELWILRKIMVADKKLNVLYYAKLRSMQKKLALACHEISTPKKQLSNILKALNISSVLPFVCQSRSTNGLTTVTSSKWTLLDSEMQGCGLENFTLLFLKKFQEPYDFALASETRLSVLLKLVIEGDQSLQYELLSDNDDAQTVMIYTDWLKLGFGCQKSTSMAIMMTQQLINLFFVFENLTSSMWAAQKFLPSMQRFVLRFCENNLTNDEKSSAILALSESQKSALRLSRDIQQLLSQCFFAPASSNLLIQTSIGKNFFVNGQDNVSRLSVDTCGTLEGPKI